MLRRYCHTISILAAAVLMSLPVVSCSTASHNHTHSYRPYSERRNRGGNDEIIATDTLPEQKITEPQKPTPRGNALVSDEWARLDIKLGKHDNKALYKELKRWLGTPYAYGDHTLGQGTDCSGLVMEVYLSVYGIKVHRNSTKMLEQNCEPIGFEELKEGDLIFFITSSDGHVSHVGIYLKDNKFVHASSSRGVVVDDIRQNYYATHYHTAARVVTR